MIENEIERETGRRYCDLTREQRIQANFIAGESGYRSCVGLEFFTRSDGSIRPDFVDRYALAGRSLEPVT